MPGIDPESEPDGLDAGGVETGLLAGKLAGL